VLLEPENIRVFLGLAVLPWLFCASETTNHRTEMLGPITGSNGPQMATVICVGLSKDLGTHDQVSRHVQATREHGSASSDQVGTLASRSLLDPVCLLMNTFPALTETVTIDMAITKAVIMVCGVFIVDPRLERKAAGGDIRYNPYLIPFWVTVPPNCFCAEPHGRVLLVSGGQTRFEFRHYVWIRGYGVDVCHWKLCCAVEGKFDGKAWWCSGDLGVVEASSWAVAFLLSAMLLFLLVLLISEGLRLLVELGRVANSFVAIGLGGDLLVVHD